MVSVPPSTSSPSSKSVYRILAGKLFVSHERKMITKQVITVNKETGIILDVRSAHEELYLVPGADVEVVDLNHLAVLPGFVDVHVHLFLHPYSETSWQDQLTKESLAERTLRASVHARRTLLAGFTTVRDLGTEGAFDADLSLRKCLAGKDPIIHGPRYYVANRAIVPTGAYGPKSTIYSGTEGIEGVTGAEVVDGRDACIRAVRRQIGAGADWIKIYADYRRRSRMADVAPTIASQNLVNFNDEELEAMITTAHAYGVKVAVHANTPGAISTVLRLGADTVEHGGELFSNDDDYTLKQFKEANGKSTWVPTLAAFYTTAAGTEVWERCKRSFQKALELDMDNIACGGDTAVFAHGQNALELVLMRKLGASWNQVLSWATLGGWKCVRGMEWEGKEGKKKMRDIDSGTFSMDGRLALEREVPFGAVRPGWAADLVAVDGVLDGGVNDFEKTLTKGVKFVMKGGKAYKEDGTVLNECFL
ncbi:hypothetical protein BDQ12DRAFT_677818 [Crucibulum laeve]|uniref:Amidohydrolase-related domain-containing protein n=1 Tax=Crucibulum laeve TaxID=68775 RepID=A0A5C3MC35_9AGAR|nr:hypothetical protein BDQ12DRAFT_677818 [Crucibulum laeve]